MKSISMIAATAVLGFSACGSVENDPIYQELLANAPTEIPARHLPRLRSGLASCEVFNEGRTNQYMTCWWPGSVTAFLSYYGPNPLLPPEPSLLSAPGGEPVSGRIKIR